MSGSLSTGGVDSGIALQAGRGVQQADPVQTIGRFADIQNALNTAKLFPGQLQQQGIATQGQQLGLQKAQNAAAYQVGLPVVANPNFTLDDLAGAWGSAEKNMGIATHQQVADIASLPLTPNTPEWRQAVKNIIVSRSQVDPGAAVATITPHTGPTIDVGPTIQPTVAAPAGSLTPGQVSPAGGSFEKGIGPQFVGTGAGSVPTNNGAPVGNPITNQLSPAQLATPTQIGVDKNGAPVMGTLEQFLNKTGASPLGTGRPIPPALRGPNAPAAGVVTGIGPAQSAAQTETGGTSARAFNDITNQGVAARSQGAVLDNMLADTAQFTTGPGADTIQKLREIGTRLGFPVDKDATSASESFNKLASQLADAQGVGSDARLAVNQAANPHSSLSPEGVDLILRQLRGNADYLQARQTLAAGYPDKADRAGFEKSIGTNLDPRVFQYSRMTPEQKATYFSSLKDKGTFKKAYGWATDNGLIGAINATQ